MFVLSLNRLDRLRLISANTEVLHCVGSVIQQCWNRGIQQAGLFLYDFMWWWVVSSNYKNKSELLSITDKNKPHTRPCQNEIFALR